MGEIVARDPENLAALAADFIADRTAHGGDFRLVLAGGSTPRLLYDVLASDAYRRRIAWDRVSIFFGDERFVPHDDPRSNYRMARETLLSRVPIPADRIHPIPTDGTPNDCAQRYETLLKQIYGSPMLDPSRPLFDFVLLGLGTDGHIASLFPGEPALKERRKWVVAVARDEPRITLTFPALEASTAIAFLVTGADKAEAVRIARAGDHKCPAGMLRPYGDVFWFLDSASAGR